MATISVTTASVLKGTGAATVAGTAGETITPGLALYIKASDSKLYGADADLSAEAATVAGIALHTATAGQPIVYITEGPVALGAAATTVGITYFAHTTSGQISDTAITGYQSIIGVASSTTTLYVKIFNSGYQKA